MFKFTDHVHEIWTIAKEKKMPVDIAYDMYRTDVSLGESENTEGMIPDIEFATAQSEWEAMSDDEQTNEFEEWHYILRYGYSDFVRTYPIREDMDAVVRKLRKKYKAKKETKNDD